jgi:DNA-binding transcriptional LysR family regulator
MDLKRLKTFIRVAQTLNLSEAARQIHRTQSSVTGQMQALEADLGVALFDRSNRKLALTAAGECLLGYAGQLIDLADQAHGAVLAAGGVACQTLDVGGIETIAAAFLPDVVARMAATRPDVNVRLAVASTAELHAGVRDGTLDAAVFFGARTGRRPRLQGHRARAARPDRALRPSAGRAHRRLPRRHRTRTLPRDRTGLRLPQDVRDGVPTPPGWATADRRRIRQRRGDRAHVADFGQRRRRLRQAVGRAARDDDRRTVGQQRPGEGKTHAGTSAGDQYSVGATFNHCAHVLSRYDR